MGLSDFFKKGVEKPVPPKPEVKPQTPPVEQPVQPSMETYTVKKGDSLSLIAKHIYGDAQKWKIIFEANKSQIKDPDKIFPDMVLNIPKK